MRRVLLFALTLLWALLARGGTDPSGDESRWHALPPRKPAVDLYFFWSARCPHCQEARPFVESLPAGYPWIRLHSLEILEHPENRSRFQELATRVGIRPESVPTFLWCGEHHTGYAGEGSTGRFLLRALAECYLRYYGEPPAGFEQPPGSGVAAAAQADALRVELPWPGGSLDAGNHSLAVLAVVLGGLDAFNPCAFFVLLFLLSLLVNTHSRGRMLLVGGLFVLVSGLVYFAFMAAWLNLFHVLGQLTVITVVAGAVAFTVGLINVKDYFWLRQGVTLSLSDRHKERLFARMRGLIGTERTGILLLSTLTLALAANTYELLCTLGLPMVFTRALTLEPLPPLQYYGYLGLYNVVYVLPLAIIVGLFVATMGRRKLTEGEGRFLKLLSGALMCLLGLALLVSPQWLSSPLAVLALIGAALGGALAVHALFRRGRTEGT